MRAIYEKMLKESSENWFIYEDEWNLYWDYNSKMIDAFFHEDKGFVFINNLYENPHIVFAFTNKNYRKQGVMKKLMSDVFKKYKNKTLTLSSLDETTDIIWKKIGFTCVEHRASNNDTSEYEKKL